MLSKRSIHAINVGPFSEFGTKTPTEVVKAVVRREKSKEVKFEDEVGRGLGP
jgi:hypothetical protein